MKSELEEEDAVTFESLMLVYVKISTIQTKIKKGNIESLTQDEILALKDHEEKLQYYLKMLENSKKTNDATKEKLIEIKKFIKKKKNIFDNNAQAKKMEENNNELNALVEALEKMKMDEAIKKLLKKLKRDQTEMARLMNIVLEEGMESLEKREFYRLEVLKKEVGDTLEEIENNPSVSISVKVKLTQIEKRNKETVRQVESISVQNSSEEIFILLQLIMENQDSDRRLKVDITYKHIQYAHVLYLYFLQGLHKSYQRTTEKDKQIQEKVSLRGFSL